MNVDKIKRGTFAGSDSADFKIGKNHLNGLILVLTNITATTRITIKRRMSSGPNAILANAVRLSDLQEISDLRYGYNSTPSARFQYLYNQLAAGAFAAGTVATNLANFETAFGEAGLVMMYIDLGSIHLDESELEGQIDWGAGTAGAYGIYAVSIKRSPDFMRQYDLTYDADDKHAEVSEIYLSAPSASSILSVDETTTAITAESAATVRIEDGKTQVISDVLGCLAMTHIFAKSEGLATQRVVQLYEKPDAVPSEVWCQVQGVTLDSSNYALIIVREVYGKHTSESTLKELESLRSRVQELERREPAKAEALRHAGAIVKAETMAEVIKDAKASE